MSILLRGRAHAITLAPGFVDAGFASLGGFAASLYAARFFEVGQLGVFSLFLTMFVLLAQLPAQLVIVPAQVFALDFAAEERPRVFTRSVPLALAVGLATTPLVWLVLLLAPEGAAADFVAFGVTTSLMVVLSPLQDHVRFVLHMAARSRAAALVSAAQFGVAVAAIGGLHFGGVPERWIPFLGLSIANAGSLTLGLMLLRVRWSTALPSWPGLGRLLRSGRVLLLAHLLPFAGMLSTAAIVARLASTEALGAAEAARVVAAPVLVVGVGLAQVLSPRAMSAARANRMDEVASTIRLTVVAVLVLALAYLAVFGWSHRLNVVEAAIPLAFGVTGLAAFRIIAAAGTVIGAAPGGALLGMEDNRGLLIGSAVGFGVQLLLAVALAAAFGAHTVPAVQLVSALVVGAVVLPRVHGLSSRLFRRPAVGGSPEEEPATP
jgi:O-antigen/teichoic acid export membrane protein